MPFLGLLTAGLVLCGMLTDPLLAAEVDCTGVEGAFKGQAALAFSMTMGAPMRSEGLTAQQMAELRRRQPNALIKEQVTADGDQFVSVAFFDGRPPHHVTALAGHYVVFNGEEGEVMAQGTDFSGVLEEAGL